MAAFCWLMIFLMLLTDDPNLVRHTKSHDRRSVASAAVRVERAVSATPHQELIKAIKKGDLSTVEDLIGRDVDVNYNSGAALSTAAEAGHLEIIKKLLQAGAYPDGTPANSSSLDPKPGYPLYLAAADNRMDIVDLLLESGADVNADQNSALNTAAGDGHIDIVKLMLEEGANPSAGHVLKNAVASGHLEVVKTLLEAGSNITYSTESDPEGSPLHSAAINGHIDVIEVLVEYGADINAPFAKDIWWDIYGDFGYQGKGWTVMHLAARWGHQPILQKLVDLGALINAADEKGYTPLHVAVNNMKIEVVDKLLELCADSNLPDNKGETAKELAHRFPHAMSDHPQPSQMLKNLTTNLLKLKINYYPYTENFMKELAREVQETIDSNKTMSKLLEEQIPGASWSYIQVAVRRVFEDKAISGILEVFEDHSCTFTRGRQFHVPLGDQYLVRCECLPGMGRKLFINYNPQISECAGPGQN